MLLLVGLGNPGKTYEDTRHNAGFAVVDMLSKELSASPTTWQTDKKAQASVCRIADVILAKPHTYMNESGRSVRAISDYYTIAPENVWVIHDDIDLPLGKLRIRVGGASGGHNGVSSVIDHLGTDNFVRFRLGIGKGNDHVSEDFEGEKMHKRKKIISYVLSHFRPQEKGKMRVLLAHAVSAVRYALEKGTDKAMNKYN